MTETTKTADPAHWATDDVAWASRANIESAGNAARHMVAERSYIAQATADRSREATQTIDDTVADTTANAAADLTKRAAEQVARRC